MMKQQKNKFFMSTCALSALLLNVPSPSAHAAEDQMAKCGVIDVGSVLNNSLAAKEAKQRLEKEFKPRDEVLQRRAKELRRLEYQQDLAKESKDEEKSQSVQKELDQFTPTFQRDIDEFKRDLARRRDEELKAVIKTAEAAYKKLASQEAYQKIYQTTEAEPIFYVPAALRWECSVKKDISVDVIRLMDADAAHAAPQ